MVDTKDEFEAGNGRKPDRFQEVERELRRLEGERAEFFRSVKPLLQVAAVALARERGDTASSDGTGGATDLSSDLAEFFSAINRGEADLDGLATVSDRLANHFRIRGERAGRPGVARPASAPARTPGNGGRGDGGAPGPDPAAAAFRNTLFAEFLSQAGSVRSGRYAEQVKEIRAVLKAGEAVRSFAETLSSFLVRLVADMRGERQEIAIKLSTIIRTLVNLENEFRVFLDKSITYLGENEAIFTENMAVRVERIQERLIGGGGSDGDPESLINLITEEMEAISSALRQKTEEDESRMCALRDEKSALESSLDTVRRDYDTFVRQSRQMLKEIEEMRSIALRDGLTKVFNRRAYDEQLLLTLLNFKSGKLVTFSLVIFDIDHFRDVNNNYGHQAGDRILVHLANTVTSSLRCDDFVFRYGGDEFVLLLPGAALADGLMVAEKIRRAVENVEFILVKGGEESLRVTISMGVAEARPGDTPGSILARADRALYASKNAGRNRVTAASDDQAAQPPAPPEGHPPA
ncbi:MAG: GGDEF domain-containing protein [Deltaproteobacteria bacterium]|jgi:diguanylate cyclase (GGDEF)-like protein|nr:GGDEF domain-containing protein [Deltaproteobacteria bacterium]